MSARLPAAPVETDLSARLMVNITDYGADAALSDNYTAIRAALDAAEALRLTNGTSAVGIYIPPGEFNVGSEIAPGGVHIVGASPYVSCLRWQTDLGAGKYAIKAQDALVAGYIKGLRLRGTGGVPTNGVAPREMHGIRLPGGWRLKECRIEGFKWGVHGYGDHWWIDDCSFGGSYFNLMWDDKNRVNKYDQCLTNSRFDRASVAHIAVGRGGAIGSSVIQNVHLAHCPYFFYGFDDGSGATEPVMAIGNAFIDVSMEGPGNGWMYAEGQLGRVRDNTFLNCGTDGGLNADMTWGAADSDYMFYLSEFSHNRTIQSTYFVTAYADLGTFAPGTDLGGNHFELGADANLDNAYTGGRDWMPAGYGDSAENPTTFHILEGDKHGAVHRCSEAVTAGDVLGQFYDATYLRRNAVRPWQTGDPVLGFAYQGGVAGDSIPVIKRGHRRVRTTTGNFDVGGTTNLLRPDGSNAGRVKAATGYTDRPIVGVAHTSIGGTLVAAQIGGDIA